MSDTQVTSAYIPANTYNKAMPQHVDAENSVLTAMIINEEARSECLIQLEPDCFYTPANRRIFLAIQDLFDQDKPVDIVTLSDYLETHDALEKIGGRTRLVELTDDPFALASWRHHITILTRDLTLRRMIEASAEISALAYDAPENTNEVVDKAESMILNITEKNISSNYRTIEDIMSDLYTQLGEISSRDTDVMGVQTGFNQIDRNLLGLREGQMIVIGARPAVGKTSFALNLAVNAAIDGASVAFFSLEMSSLEIAQRLLASRSGVDMQAIRSGKIKKEEWTDLLRATEELSALDILIDDTPGTTITEIRAKARRMLHDKKKGLVILDYLQLVSPPAGRRSDSRATEVSEMSRGIKIMAKDLQVPVIALSQLSRASKQRTEKTPQLSDLRESGSIEQDADIVILLDRSSDEEEAKKPDRPDLGITRFIIAKNRSGPVATIDLMFLGGKTKFIEADLHHEE